MTDPEPDEPDDDEDGEAWDSGPFCRHYSDPASCDILCARAGCRHGCVQHDLMKAEDGGYGCMVEDCECPDWKEPEE